MGGFPLFVAETAGVRYQLRFEDHQGDLHVEELPASNDGARRLSVSLKQNGTQSKVIYQISQEAVHKLLPDGTLETQNLLTTPFSAQGGQFFYRGRPRRIDRVGGLAGKQSREQQQGSVAAPMNGQVVKITREVGQLVEAGDLILILEAMKMENEVTAPIPGMLNEICVGLGDSVSPGQLLFSVDPQG